MMRAGFIVAAGFASTVAAIAASIAGSPETQSEKSRICSYGYASAHRMSKQESMLLKGELMAAYCDAHHIASCRFGDYELDHVEPLCLGGGNERDNLQIQPWAEARIKDRLEAQTCRAYCAGQISLEDARARFKRD